MDRGDVGILAGAVLAILVIIALLYYSESVERGEWEDFVAAHNCKIVSKAFGVDSNQTGWLCDDGITYYRED